MALLAPWAVAQQALPYSYGFEDNDLSIDGWTKYFGTSHSGNNGECGIVADAKRTGDYGFRFSSYHESGTEAQYLISPELTAPTGVVVSLYYAASTTYSSGEKFKVGYSTTTSDVASFTWSNEYSTKVTSWNNLEETFPVGTKYIAIYYYASYQYRLYIDDISLTTPPNCLKPTNLTCATSTNNSATLSWVEAGDAEAWILEYDTDSEFSTDPQTITSSFLVEGSNISVDIMSLASNTTYYAHVKADCGGEQSDWTNAISFKTQCDPETILTWSENFDSYTGTTSGTTNNLPGCWNYINTCTHNSYKGYPIVYNGSSYTASNHLHFYSYYSSYSDYDPQDQYAILPPMDNLDGKQITLWAKGGNAYSIFMIGRMTDPFDASTFDEIATQALTTSYQEFTYQLSGASGNYIAIKMEKANSTATSRTVYIDDITIADVPSCSKPSGLAYSEVKNHSAKLNWTENGGADTWDVAYKKSTDDDFTVIEGVTVKPYILTGLTPETAYTVKVRANCGGSDGVSEWSSTVNFTTKAQYVAPTALTCTAVTSTTATLSWTENSDDGTAWQICLNDDVEHLVEADTNPFTLTGLTAETVYTAKVRTYYDAEHQSAWTSNISFEPTVKIVIGSGNATSQYVPTETYYNYAISQQIYTTTELGAAGYITSIDFYCTGSTLTRNLDVYMVSTDKSTFSNNQDWIEVTSADLMFSGDVTFTQNAWNTIPVDFIYEGTQNIAIIIDDNTEEYPSTQIFSVFDADSQAIYTFSDYDDYDPSDLSAFSGTVFQKKNIIRVLKGDIPSCPKPTGVTVEPLWNTATISWTGTNDSYAVHYRTSETTVPSPGSFSDDFEDGLGNWTLYTLGEGSGRTKTNPSSFGALYSAHSGNYVAMARSYEGGADIDADNWMISPQLTIPSTMSYWVQGDAGYPETYHICVSTTDKETTSFSVVKTYTTNPSSWTQETIDLSAYAGATGYIAFHHEASAEDYLWIDDVLIGGTTVIPAGEWVDRSTTETSIELTGLTTSTMYDYQVKGICGGPESDWTTLASFTTKGDDEKWFTTAGNWNEDANWTPSGAPTASTNVVIKANVVIPSDYIAKANNVTVQGTSTITIRDGGEFEYTSGTVTATVEKFIKGYGEGNGKWYLISALGSMASADVENLLTADYDYYRFDGTDADAEWKNYKKDDFANTFDMTTGWGYLYAHKTDVTLRFTRELLNPGNYYAGGNPSAYLAFDGTKPLGKFTLLGNVYARKAYLIYYPGWTDITDFYVMNAAGTEVVANTNPYLLPNQGVFVEATEASQLALVATEPMGAKASNSSLNVTLVSNNEVVDIARVRFGEGNGLEKYQINTNHTKLYIPNADNDYAVTYRDAAEGVMPLNFKAETTKYYTISVKPENMSFSYLHLIDNFTGENIDLLIDHEYTFIGSPRDDENRFRIVFSANGTNNDNDEFIYQNGDELIVNGEGELQVYDVMGRYVASYNINGNKRISAEQFSNAVYIFRLIGSDVKTQKIVVR